MTPGPNHPDTRDSHQKKQDTAILSSPAKKVMVLKSVSKSPGHKEKIYKFDKERIVLGSVISADVRLSGDGISPIHAVLEISGTVFDLASDTGIFVNDQKVITQVLKDGDILTLGRHQLQFSFQEKSQKGERTRETGGRTLYLNPDEDLAPLNLQDESEIIQIFDFRPTSKRALEVVMSWHGAILNVEHFVSEKSVTVGSSQKSDFGIPSLLSSQSFALVTRKHDGGFVLNLDKQMKGVMQQGGSLLALADLPNQSEGRSSEIVIGNNDFAKISIGEVDFYLSYTAAPPRLKRRRILERDPFFFKIFSCSMVLTALALFTIMKVKLPQGVEAEQMPERIATILYQPEKYLTPPPVPVAKPVPKPVEKVVVQEPEKPKVAPPPPIKKVVQVTPKAEAPHKPLPKVLDTQVAPKKPAPVVAKAPSPTAKPAAQNHPAPKAAAKEGEGARAKGKEGSRGEPNKKDTGTHVTSLSRPSPHTGNQGAAGNSQVVDEGNVDILKGAGGRIQNILGNSAAHLGDGSEKLKGFGNFSSGGRGGLALAGSGQGGGGNAETTLGGLGKKGSGMGRVGTGAGAAGNGTGIVGSQARVDIRIDGPEEAVVMGSIDRDAIAEAIFAHKDEFRLCYEREINAEHPTLAGQIGTSFVIGSSGRVTKAGIESSSLNNSNTERCMLTVLKRIQFPAPRGGGIVEVKFPFKFSSGHG